MPEQLIRGIAGIGVLIAIAFVCSRDRRMIRWKIVLTGIVFNMLFAVLILRTPGGRKVFEWISGVLLKILQFSAEGTSFVFGPLFDGFSRVPGYSGSSFVFVLGALIPIIFFGALVNMLYYLGIMPRIVKTLAWGLKRLFGLGGPEATVAASNIFVGQVQGAMTVAPYLAGMTEAQLFQVMVVGMSTVGAGMPLVYAGMGARMEYVLAANIMAVPAAVVFAKILLPERQMESEEEPLHLSEYDAGVNLLDALGRGAMAGWKVVLAVSVMLLAFIPLVHLLNWVVVTVSSDTSNLQAILGWLFIPAAFIVGVPPADSAAFARLVGTKTAFNEVIAFGGLAAAGLSPKGFMLTCFALTGFANFTSIAIQIGGIGELAPSRKADVARLGLRCVLAATLANLLSAAIAGMLIGG
jgi:CNT family concentrative nucleoside transporter